MMKRLAWTIAVLAALLGAGGQAKAGNLLVNGDFENEPNFGPGATIDRTNGTSLRSLFFHKSF
jgi:hypothetical protein